MPSGSVMLILERHFILVLYCPVAQHCLKVNVPFSLSLFITVYIYIIGFGDRLLLEMKKITPNSLKIRVNLSLSLSLSLCTCLFCLFFRYLLHKIESTQHGWGMLKIAIFALKDFCTVGLY